jgi:NADH:ubiquinone oxidoreductase subunit 6 (subunit J)
MITAKQRFYFMLFLFITLLGGSVIFIFTETGDISKLLGLTLAGSLFSLCFLFLVILLKEKLWDWKVMFSGKRVTGVIISIEASYLLNLPVIIHYLYRVGKEEYQGSTWTTIHYLDRVPSVGSDCWVVYDEKHPHRSIIEGALKPPH